MSDSLYAVVMAGGGGTRLWPVSRRNRPKQALNLLGEESLFQATISRLLPLIPADRITVVTVEDQAELLRRQTPVLSPENFLIEPSPRGTAAVIGMAAVELARRDPEAVMICLPADHVVQNDQRLRDALSAAEKVARQDFLVTLGLEPTGPETGYGYLEKGEGLPSSEGFNTFEVRSFKEKPGAAEAEAYVKSRRFLWNAGIFAWKCKTILGEIQQWMPDLALALSEIEKAGSESRTTIERLWPGIKPQTIDYGVMEKAGHVAMLEVGDLGWLDVGSWDRLFEALPRDDDGNVILAEAVALLDTTGSLVYQDDASEAPRLIALVGVKDLIVVDAGDAILVTSRAHAQQVRELVKSIQAGQGGRYL
jgi:mannose-1-phosphate guanylyltransferase